jgi:hypothetical protein
MTIHESDNLMTTKTTRSRRGKREDTLLQLVPKTLGILWKDGHSSSRVAVLPKGVELSACYLAPNRVMLSAYSPVHGRMVKVFSAHVTERPELGDPTFYRYVSSSVGLLSWKRGEWEVEVMAHAAQAKTAAGLLLKLQA